MLVLQVCRVVADLGKSALMRIARLTNSLAKGPKRNVTRVQWLCWRRRSRIIERWDPLYTITHQIHDNLVAYPRIWSRRSLHRFYGRAQTYRNRSDVSNSRKPLHVTLTFKTKILRLEWFAQVDLMSVTPMLAPKFEDRSQEETEWQEQGAREAAWKLAKSVLKFKEKTKQHSSHLRKTGACLHKILDLRNENLLLTPAHWCIWSANRTWILLKWVPWRSRVVLRPS